MRTPDELTRNVIQAQSLPTERERVLHLYWIAKEAYQDALERKQPWWAARALAIVRQAEAEHPWLAEA